MARSASALPTCKTKKSSRPATPNPIPPKKTFGFCFAKPMKKPSYRATIPVPLSIWCNFTIWREPVSSEARKLSPAACADTPALAPPENPTFDSFFEIPPPYFSFLVEKVGFSGGSTTIYGRDGRASLRRRSRHVSQAKHERYQTYIML